MDITPFTLTVPQHDIDDLAERLARTRWPAPLPGDDWTTGTPAAYLHGLVDAWAHQFDWRATEARLNAHPQFITTIDGTQIHFLHVRSRHANAVPLLLGAANEARQLSGRPPIVLARQIYCPTTFVIVYWPGIAVAGSTILDIPQTDAGVVTGLLAVDYELGGRRVGPSSAK